MQPKITPAGRMQTLSPHFFATLSGKIAAIKATGLDVIRLDEGAPDMPPAPFIIQALADAAMEPDVHSYQPHRGPDILREAWSFMYKQRYHVDLDPRNEIIPLLGSKEGIFHFLQAFIEPGDLVLVPDPGYITYTRGTLFAGGNVEYFTLDPDSGYLPDLELIPSEVAHRAKLMWLNYPNNPTGAFATLDFFRKAVDFAKENNLFICHDAAYTQITFSGNVAPSILQVAGAKDVSLEFNSLSKSHNMAGWRVGAAVGQPDVLKVLFNLKTNADSSHFYPILFAASQAMTGDQSWLVKRNEIYHQRSEYIVNNMKKMGFKIDLPAGSLYTWCRVPTGWTSNEFVLACLERAHVSFTPGTIFGANGEGYIRIAITESLTRIEEAMVRLARFMAGL